MKSSTIFNVCNLSLMVLELVAIWSLPSPTNMFVWGGLFVPHTIGSFLFIKSMKGDRHVQM